MILEVEYFLLAVLLIFMYVKPSFLNNVRKNSLMKLLIILLTIFITSKYGITSGVLMSIIFILLLNDSKNVQLYDKKHFEGFSSEKDKEDTKHYTYEKNDEDCKDCKKNITDLSREFELNTERNLYNYRHANYN
tara:strand:- start:344 stop:745 length:402 start_codon:yes stop_codon:yes gene_type:complete